MPKSGWTSITVKVIIYDKLFAQWKREEDAMNLKGISSFSGYITFLLQDKIYPVDLEEEYLLATQQD